MQALDALHVAFAAEAKANYLRSCDAKLITRTKRVGALQTEVAGPPELAAELAP